MLRRCSVQLASRWVAESQGASSWQTLAHQPLWHGTPAAAAAAPAAAHMLHHHMHPGGMRWRSELVQHKDGETDDVVYVGPFSNAVTRVKKLSLFSCACALGAGPIILGLDAGTTATAKVSIVATLASFGVFTTGLLTWFTQPYVHRLRYERGTDTLEATTLTLLARPRQDRFHVGEVEEAAGVHPLTSFQARGRRFYIDAEHFPDKALLSRLAPQAAAAHVMDAANQQQQQAAAEAAKQQPQQQRQE